MEDKHYDLEDLNLNKKQQEVFFSILHDHASHELEVIDTTDNTGTTTEYEVECKTCEEVILRAYNPDMKIDD